MKHHRENRGGNEICRRPPQTDPQHIFPGVAKISGIHRNGFCPPDHLGEHQHDRSYQVQVADGVEGQPSGGLRCRVTQSVRYVPVVNSWTVIAKGSGSNQGDFLNNSKDVEIVHILGVSRGR